jgi:hypothetical protein
MTWVIWRQYRLQTVITAAIFAVYAAVVLVTGLDVASQWHSILVSCAGSQQCLQQQQLGNVLGNDARVLSDMVPALIGLFWGAPLVAHEIEAGTTGFAWTQGVTRRRWLYTKIGWILLAAAIWGGAVSALVTWWSGPFNASRQNLFQPNTFDQQFLVPVGYAVFATALGICAGTVLRRTLPAMAVVIGVFIGIRVGISQYLRQHFLPAVTHYYTLGGSFSPPAGSWILSQGITGPALAVPGNVTSAGWDGIPASALPASCQALIPNGPGSAAQAQAINACIRNAHIRAFFSYQPADRFWAFQGIETGIYLLLAIALVFVAARVLLRRDA